MIPPPMATQTSVTANGTDRRLLLVDFDWQDADLMPELLQQPGVSVRLVAGAGQEDAGIRLAELCGLPRTLDLADLTREIFDLALVSERSPRRTQIEGLLLALGTPSVTPQAFLAGDQTHPTVPAVEAPLAVHAAAFESAVGGADFDAIMEQALPDVSADAPTAPTPVEITGRRAEQVVSLDDFPSPEDRRGLEAALRGLMAETGAGRAELHLIGPDQVETVVEVGPADALLRGLVELATDLGTAQVVGGLSGTQEGKAWGAWPFRTPQRHGVIAAAGIDPAKGWATWERTMEDLRAEWDRRDRAQAGAAFPLLPDRHPRWLTSEEFAMRLELGVERNRRDGLRFAVHQLTFPGAQAAVEALCERLPGQLRDTDCMTHPTAQTIVLLTAGAPGAFTHLRRRLLTLWDEVWTEAGEPKPAPTVSDEHVQIICPADAPAFLSTGRSWSATG
jgi:hypothetical protein